MSSVLFLQGGGEGAHAADALLAQSLQAALGDGYDVRFPLMPDEGDPQMGPWKGAIAAALGELDDPVVVVAHSMGGAIALNYFATEGAGRPIAALYLLATPSKDDEGWNFPDLVLPDDLADRFASIPRVVFFGTRDDEMVPITHLALHAARLPAAIVREVESGGHQFGNDLTAVAQDLAEYMYCTRPHARQDRHRPLG